MSTFFHKGEYSDSLTELNIVLPKHKEGEHSTKTGIKASNIQDQNRSAALEWSPIHYWGLKPIQRDPILALILWSGPKLSLYFSYTLLYLFNNT